MAKRVETTLLVRYLFLFHLFIFNYYDRLFT